MTVFCGTNSTGKSTLLKTLLLLRQSQGIHESYETQPGRLRFIGSQIDLGNYTSFVSHNDTRRDISIAVTINNEKWTSASHFFESPKTKDKNHSLPRLLRCHFRFGAIFTEQVQSSQTSIFTSTQPIQETLSSSPQGLLKEATFDFSVGKERLLSWQVVLSNLGNHTKSSKGDNIPVPIELGYDMLIPQDYFEETVGYMNPIITMAAKVGYVRITTVIPRGLLPEQVVILSQETRRNGDTAEQEPDVLVFPFSLSFDLIGSLLSDFQQALTNIDYLGPLRSPAKRYYLTYLDSTPPIDSAGEFLPHLLRDKDKFKAWYLPPGQLTEPREELLPKALNAWIYYIRTGQKPLLDLLDDELDLETAKVLVEFKIKAISGQESHPLADSGFGYSQILPIIVRGLLLPKGSTLIVEQPELHLNPAIQIRLAEFFVAMVRAGKQILIETHSEHIVNAIRVLTAEDETGELAAMCGIFYIGVEADRPVIHELSIKSDGTVPDWPQDFFGEAASLAGRLLRAQKRFRKQAKAA